MSTFPNSVHTDVMPHYAAFHQGLHCLLETDQDIQNVVQDLQNVESGMDPKHKCYE